MTNNELLLSISNMLDKKLEPIKTDIRELKEDVAVLKEDVAVLKEDVAVLKEDVAELKTDVYNLKEDMSEAKRDITNIQNNMIIMNNRMRKIELVQENHILPRLNTIEACYTSTSKRYQESVKQIDAMQTDIDILKCVVTEHSYKLQKIS